MKRSDVIEKLKNLIEEEREITIDANDQKLDIDSFTMTLIISSVNDEFGVTLDMETLDFDAFTSLNTLADLVEAEEGNQVQ
ncbi:MAG TPA: acyl carrier protein [Nitrospinaceae bacterium]|jgi:acyl carrier protein|uniref:Carrier domain-containing protein n=1 Tax=marine metagenome TaxID=408172 RepID=A0A382A9K4_9ZZZZ|nr:phosphopantetheine-binding protein [Candidatus Neomarinimicrobiota bacterium]HIB43630.1 acyl carrier protein [Nitrospina sp.]HIN88379.1 acyl carrier protein [Nitrospinaceae bacterium]HIO23597.1 acyl carrier protein [Nitrospinaceae bacterium]